jgi:hypothetical protein
VGTAEATVVEPLSQLVSSTALAQPHNRRQIGWGSCMSEFAFLVAPYGQFESRVLRAFPRSMRLQT